MNNKILIDKCLAEDIGHADITTDYLGLLETSTTAFLIAKENGIIAGLDVAIEVFLAVDEKIKIIAYKKDGDAVSNKEEIAKIQGNAASILKAERVALNFMQRLSGIATLTRAMVDEIKGTSAKLLDTRKTTPGLRKLEKMAVRMGGGYNHRFGLYDMIMLKENHLAAAGGIPSAMQKIALHNTAYKVEIEVKNLAEAQEAVACKAQRIMLDNMSLVDMRKAARLYANVIELEASGNVTINNIKEIAETGVHYISTGAITHSYKSLDISLLFKEKQ